MILLKYDSQPVVSSDIFDQLDTTKRFDQISFAIFIVMFNWNVSFLSVWKHFADHVLMPLVKRYNVK